MKTTKTANSSAINKWWGEFRFALGEKRQWRLGQCEFYLERGFDEWRIITQYIDSIKPCSKHFGFQKTPEVVFLSPVLADRPQISRPEFPFYVPAYEQVNVYINTPVWVRIETGSPRVLLQEFSSQYLSDTWFGENAQRGELCYADLGHCATNYEEALNHVHQVTSCIVIQNDTNENLLVHRIKLPLSLLSIYADENNKLWTENLLIENHPPPEEMITNIIKAVPSLAKEAKLINSPRLVMKSSSIIDIVKQIL